MNVNLKIEKIFENFIVDEKLIPIAYAQYFGGESIYLTYYTWAENPELFADNDYHEEVCHCTIDIWSKENFKNVLEAVKQKLKQNNLTWTGNGPEMYEADTGFFHVPVNFYVTSEVIKSGK